ncbi:MAG: PAS domain S-box protein [Atribacterota bacterium]|nr:PAS domain S-box protein [Atribacterota bacterium]
MFKRKKKKAKETKGIKSTPAKEKKFIVDAIINAMPDVIIVLDLNGVILFVNPAHTKILGWKPEERIGKSFDEFGESIKAEDIEKFMELMGELIEKGHVEPIESIVRTKDGREVPMSVTYSLTKDDEGNPAYIIASLRDITELKLVEEKLRCFSEELELKVKERTKELKEAQGQLIQSEKFSIIGELAAGVAHEVRNPLATISLIAQHLEKKVTDNYQIEKLKAIQRNIDRIDKIVYGLLNFSHPPRSNFAYHNVNEILDRLSFLENLPSENIKVIKKYETKLPQAWFNPDRLEQVFLNLIFNAMRAMKNGGKLYITTSFDSTRKGIIIKFEDMGAGISEENLKNIFNPFFTTYKEGTGLGLSICQNIINEHKGNISVESKLGKGTTFTIFLPLEKRKEKKQVVDGIQ